MRGTTFRHAAIAIVIVTFTPTAAPAQGRIGISGYGVVGNVRLDADRTFDAVAGSSGALFLGGGVQLTRLWNELFVDVAFSQLKVNGERVAVGEDGAVQPIGIPLQVRMRPFDLAIGWRTQYRRFSIYGGGGVSRLMYKETSDGAQAREDVTTSSTGPLILAGIDVKTSHVLRIGGELRYRHIGGILGEGGASAIFREGSAGGLSAGLRVSVGH
jgi:hypothetical protein